jgi:hypothetical protein
MNEKNFKTESTVKVLKKEGFWYGKKDLGKLICIDTPVIKIII